jgi:hypothetical protein
MDVIACDHCEARTRQPLPHGWRVLWISDARAYGHACPSCGERLDAGERLPQASEVSAPAFVLEAAVRDELGLPASALAEAELHDLPQGDMPPPDAPVHSHGSDAPASAVDDHVGRDRRDAAAIRPPSPKLIEPAEGVEIYDRPRLPRTLRDAPDGASVEAFVRKVGETFVPPAATRPRAAAPLVKSPSEPPPPAQRSLFGGES